MKYEDIKLGDVIRPPHLLFILDASDFIALSCDGNQPHIAQELPVVINYNKTMSYIILGASILTAIGTKLTSVGGLWFSQSLCFLIIAGNILKP